MVQHNFSEKNSRIAKACQGFSSGKRWTFRAWFFQTYELSRLNSI